MQELTPIEAAHYNGVREQYPQLELPELTGKERVEYRRQGIVTHAKVHLGNEAFAPREGWAVFSPIDRANGVRKNIHKGEAVAFNRALKTPIWG